MKAISLAYHDVVDDPQVGLKDVRPGIALYSLARSDFQSHMRSIREQEAQVDVIRGSRPWKERLPVFLTFDDGASNAYTYVAGELEKYGWRGHFFIATDWIGQAGFLNRQQIRELHERGHVIGSHSCTHPERMSRLTRSQLVREWSESCAILGDILEERVKIASVPNGYYSRKVGEAAAFAGIEALFTSEATAAASVVDGCLVLGRYFVQTHTPAEISGAIVAGHLWPRWKQTLLWETKKAVKMLTGKSYLAMRRFMISKVLRQCTTSDRAVSTSASNSSELSKE